MTHKKDVNLTGAGFYVRNHFPVPNWEDVEEEYEFEVLTASGTS